MSNHSNAFCFAWPFRFVSYPLWRKCNTVVGCFRASAAGLAVDTIQSPNRLSRPVRRRSFQARASMKSSRAARRKMTRRFIAGCEAHLDIFPGTSGIGILHSSLGLHRLGRGREVLPKLSDHFEPIRRGKGSASDRWLSCAYYARASLRMHRPPMT